MPSITAEQWLDLIHARAARLRSAGVTKISAEGFSAELRPKEPEAVAIEPIEDREVFVDPLSDPATFANGRVPRYLDEDNP